MAYRVKKVSYCYVKIAQQAGQGNANINELSLRIFLSPMRSISIRTS